MLLMITNRCNEGCPHCLQCSNPQGGMMEERTFIKAVKFLDFLGGKTILLSGGEPTLHPLFYEFCKRLNFDYKVPFCICSNGTWYDDEKIVNQVKRISSFEYFTGMQVYSNKLFYKDYEEIKARAGFFKSLGKGILFDENPIIAMKDLGRARNCDTAQRMSEESGYFQSCLNSSLMAKQAKHPSVFCRTFERVRMQFCHPMVDINGDVHLSESWLCQSCGNIIEDGFATIWTNMVNYQPCGGCKDYQRFRRSMRPDIIKAQEILNK